jgi:hypothetical protein
MMYKLTDLCGSWLSKNDFSNAQTVALTREVRSRVSESGRVRLKSGHLGLVFRILVLAVERIRHISDTSNARISGKGPHAKCQ